MALEKAPQFLSVLLLFTLPFLTQLQGLNPLFPKAAVTQIIVCFMLAAWALRVCLAGKITWVSSRAHWALLGLVAWGTFTVILSPFSRACLWQMGDEVIYPLWYGLLTFTCLEAWQAENLLVSFLISGLATGLWALGQVSGFGGEGWTVLVKTQFNGRPVAGLGNPDFLAGFLSMVWPLALALWIRAEKKLSGFFWGSIVVVSLAALFLTGSPGGWLGLTAGTLLLSAFVIKDKGWKGLKWLGLPLAFILASLFVSPLSNGLKGFLAPQSEDVQFQGQVWKGTVEMIQKHLMAGVGPGAFKAAFPPFRPPFLMLHQPQQAYGVENASNWILESLAETGIIGFLFLSAFWFCVLAQWWKLYKANAVSRILAAGVFAAIGAVAADNLFDLNLSTPSTCIPLLFLAAFPVSLSQRFYRMEGFPIRRMDMDISRWRIYFLPLLVILASLTLQRVGNAFQRQGADLDLKKATEATGLGKWDEALDFYDKALRLDSGNPNDLYERGSVYLDRNQPGDLEKALDDFNTAGQILPDTKLIHYQKYEVLLRLNRIPEAKEELNRAVRLDPMLVYLLDDFKKARTLMGSGHLSEALMIYQNLYFDYPTCVPMMIDYANCYAMAGDFGSAVNLYQQSLRFDPENIKALNDLQKVREAQMRNSQSGKRAYILGSELE